jgi:hypothetical protein
MLLNHFLQIKRWRLTEKTLGDIHKGFAIFSEMDSIMKRRVGGGGGHPSYDPLPYPDKHVTERVHQFKNMVRELLVDIASCLLKNRMEIE